MLGSIRTSLYGLLLLGIFPAHAAFGEYRDAHLIRQLRILSYRGKGLLRGLPVRGQRTRSNAAMSNARKEQRNTLGRIPVRMR